MKKRDLLLTLSAILIGFSGYSQHKKGTLQTDDLEIAYYYKDGVKMSAKNNTPLLLVGLNDKVTGNSPTEMAINWISKNKNLLQIKKIKNLKEVFKRSSLSGHTIRFQQILNNVPVYNAQITVHISPKNNVTYVDNLFDPSVQDINTTPSISEEKAFLLAKNNIKATGKLAFSSKELFIFNQSTQTKLIYKIIIESETPIGSWEVLVNAQNENIISAKDKSYYYSSLEKTDKKTVVNGTGNVFLSDPLSFANVSYGGNYTDNNDATNTQLDAALSSVTLLDIDLTAGQHTLKGPFAEIIDDESPFNGLFQQTSSTFNFNRNDDAFEAVNCYYLIDKSMRYINQDLNITLMPYQYSGGVQYDPHGLGGADNSHYNGGSGSLGFGEGCVDDAEDADVVIHELGHGLHDWLTGGNASSSEGLGEGSGDYWGQSYNRSLGQWTAADPEYNWFFNWDGHNVCWNGRITNYTATYPGGLVGSIHTNGQIWATTLMRIYDILGRIKVDKAFLEGLAMTGNSSGQQDAAIAVRQAAIDMGYSCADVNVFTQEFTNTGYMLPAYSCTVGIDEVNSINIKVYPNPTSNNISVILPNYTTVKQISLVDNLGRTIYQTIPTNNKTQINLTQFTKGIYILHIKTDNNVLSKKIVRK
ncbi:MAG: T9SS type A sorting domain-containing protein [Flavobacteriales bacterium]|nr:T9SS type A sorting domain-containing protein [Flavobacteriales bacterium]